DLAVVANRRNIDDHIVLLGWMLANGKKVAMNIEIVDDKWIPRIELQENDDENLVVGMAMDRTSVDFQISIPTDDGGIRKLPPCPVLLCTTIEGKLNLFSLARIADLSHVPELMVAPMAVPMDHALVATLKEKSKFENPIPSNFDSKMPVERENVNAKALQVNEPENRMVKMEDSNRTDLQKDDSEIKPIPVEKTPSTTLVTNEVDVNAKTSQARECEEEIPKVEDLNKYQLEKAYNMIKPVSSEKSTPLTVQKRETDLNAEKIQTSNQDGEKSQMENINRFQLQNTSDVLKPTLNVNFSSVKNQNDFRHDIQKTSGMLSSGPINVFQIVPKNFLADSSSFQTSSSSVHTKSEGFHTVGSISTRANESKSSFATKFNSQIGGSKADLTGILNTDVAGKGSLENVLGNIQKTGLGTVPFGSMQSPGRLLTSSMSTSKPSPVSASTSVGQLFPGVKDSYQGNTSVPGAFRSTNAVGTTASSSIFQPDRKTNISSAPFSEGSLHSRVQSQQGSQSSVRLGTHKADLKPTGRPSGISEIEADFSRELEKVRSMAKEVDDLMLTIEGKKMVSKGNSILFSKQAVLSIEEKIKKISENCNEFKERLEEEIFDIQNLRDKTMQVDAWRIYMQSIIKQATDQQYQDLRSHQKLNPELDIMRQSISKAEQRLKQKILELEGHLQNLEISKFEVSDSPKRAHQKQFQNARQLQSLQSFYNTVNSQLTVAEQLAGCLSQQMEALNISPEKSANSKNAKKESLFKSIGLSPDEVCFLSPDLKEKSLKSHSLHKFAYSPSSSASKESPIQRESIMQEPDSLRRRRDPINSAWANVGTAKTTVKRASQAPRSRPTRSRTPLESTQSTISELRTSSGMFGPEDSMSPMHQFRVTEGKVGSQSEGVMSSKPITVKSSLEYTTQASFGFSSAKTSIGRTLEGSKSGIDNRTKVSQQHELASTQIKSVSINSGKEVAESNNSASACVASAVKSAESSRPSTLLQVSNLSASSKSTTEDKWPLNAEASDYASEDTSISPSLMRSGKPFIFSKHTGSGNVSQSANALSGISLSSAEAKSYLSSGPEINSVLPKGSSLSGSKPQKSIVSDAAPEPKLFSFSMSSLATSSAKNVTMSSGHDVRTLTSQDPSFSSKPQNAISSGSAIQSKSFPSSFLSLSAGGGKSVTAQSGNSLASSAVTASPINQSITQDSVLGGLADSDLSQLGLTKTSQLDVSSLGTPSSSQISSFSSAATAVTSVAQTSAFPVSPFASPSSHSKPLFAGLGTSSSSQISSSSSAATVVSPMAHTSTSSVSLFASSSQQTKPLFSEFINIPSVASAPAFSLTSATASSFGQFSGPVSGSSGFGSQTNAMSNTPTLFGFSNSSSTELTPQQSQAASSFGQNVAILFPEQMTISPLTSSTLGQSLISGSSSAMTSVVTNEEDMEEEATTQTADVNIGSFGGFGLGSATSTVPKSNPFGGPLITGQPNPAFSLSVPTGELFKPASFSIPAAQSSPQSSPNLFGSSFGSGGGINPTPTTGSSFGQPAQPGPGQQALGSALGAFGQSRQIGLGSGLGAGFGSSSHLPGGGFKGAASGGGFAGAAGGGGFAGAAGGGGFVAAANAGTGGFSGGGFQSFGGNQGSSGFSSFGGGSSGLTNAPQTLFTQMRK
ncbi:hypothetical protein KI387_019642, partial [Taxus chinensis]